MGNGERDPWRKREERWWRGELVYGGSGREWGERGRREGAFRRRGPWCSLRLSFEGFIFGSNILFISWGFFSLRPSKNTFKACTKITSRAYFYFWGYFFVSRGYFHKMPQKILGVQRGGEGVWGVLPDSEHLHHQHRFFDWCADPWCASRFPIEGSESPSCVGEFPQASQMWGKESGGGENSEPESMKTYDTHTQTHYTIAIKRIAYMLKLETIFYVITPQNHYIPEIRDWNSILRIRTVHAVIIWGKPNRGLANRGLARKAPIGPKRAFSG